MIEPVYVGVIEYTFSKGGQTTRHQEVSRPYSNKGQAKSFITRKRKEYHKYYLSTRKVAWSEVFVSGPWVALDE